MYRHEYPATNYSRCSLFHIRVEHAFLLQIVRHGVLRQKRRLEPDFSPNPLTLRVWSIRRMVTSTTTAKLRTEVSTLNLIKLPNLFPRRIANRARDINFELQD